MKLKAKIEIIIVFIAVGIIFTFIPIFNNCDKGSEFNSTNNLSLSKVSGKIYINNNWTDAKAAGICTGLGTSSDPYVIEDLTIDGGGLGSCILIEYSTVYFRIENCTVYNFGEEHGDAGIKLYHVDNGQLIDNVVSGNTVSYGESYGIYLQSSYYIIISGNTVSNNKYIGICLRSSYYTIISGNTVNNNREGINLGDSYYTIISENTANYNSAYGIRLSSSYNNTVSGNSLNNTYTGIRIQFSDNNTISKNNINSNKGSGINLYDSNFNQISENIVNYNLYYGISLGESDSNTISENTVNNNDDGIRLYRSDNNKILRNFLNNNTYRGIHLVESDTITVSGNFMFKCGLEISGSVEILRSYHIDNITNLVNAKPLYYYVDKTDLGPYHVMNAGQVILVNCNDSVISNLNVSDSSIGISLHYCNKNDISGNIANHNNVYGIYLDSSSHNTISGNIVNENNDGLYLWTSNFNKITGNVANNNSFYAIYLHNSNYTTVSDNFLVGNDECIGEENCEGNTFSDNGSCTYREQPITDYPLIFLIGIPSVVAIIIISIVIKKLKKT